MDFDRKEEAFLQFFKNRFENALFDEKDVYSFLIFIRDHLIDLDKSKYNYIIDIGDTIAHRHRDRGVAMVAIQGAIENGYRITPASNHIEGYHGIHYSDWCKQWKYLGDQIGIAFEKNTIHDITLCVFSLLQYTEYTRGNSTGHIELFQNPNNELCVCTTEGHAHSLYINFSLLDNVPFLKRYEAGLIDEVVTAVREDGYLRLINESGEYII